MDVKDLSDVKDKFAEDSCVVISFHSVKRVHIERKSTYHETEVLTHNHKISIFHREDVVLSICDRFFPKE